MKRFSAILLSLIVMLVSFIGTTATIFATQSITIEGSHKIDGVQSGTRTFILTPKAKFHLCFCFVL